MARRHVVNPNFETCRRARSNVRGFQCLTVRLPSHIIHTGDLAARLHIIRQLVGGRLLIISSRGLKVPGGGYTADQRTSPA